MSNRDDFQRFLAWADRKGYDTAHTYDSERNKYVCLNPALADAWEAWTESKYTPAPAQPAQWICEARFDNETRIIEGSFSPAQPSAQGEAVAWLVEWKAHGHGPQWWGFNHTPGKNATWCSDANNAIRFARKEDAERMRLHIIAVAGLTGMHSYERSVSVTEHMWIDTASAPAAQPSAQGVGALALEELHQLGYTVKDGLLYPRLRRSNPPWPICSTSPQS